MPDSRGILYTRLIDRDTLVVRTGVGTDGACVWGPCLTTRPGRVGDRPIRHEIRAVTPDGKDRVIREVTASCPACVWFIGDSVVVFGRGYQTAVASLRNMSPQRRLLPDNPSAPVTLPPPTISPDGQWIAIRHGSTLHLVRTDLSARRSVELPGTMVAGRGNPVFTPDSRSAIVIVRGPAGTQTIHQVTIATGEVRSLRPMTARRVEVDEAISPDGRWLAQVIRGDATAELYEVDVSSYLGKLPAGSPRR
jgi:Tol biopolymer transport system component